MEKYLFRQMPRGYAGGWYAPIDEPVLGAYTVPVLMWRWQRKMIHTECGFPGVRRV